jgi:hypothetical protein
MGQTETAFDAAIRFFEELFGGQVTMDRMAWLNQAL